VIPREGVESHLQLLSPQRLNYVIPREGVERLRPVLANVDRGIFPVIPREGVESLLSSAFTDEVVE